jgi:hypothetical protein
MEGDDPEPRLCTSLKNTLRVSDEAFVLPLASRSSETGAFKNIVMRLSGTETELNPEVFSANWFAGVSMVPIPPEVAEPLIRDPASRKAALERMRAAVASEMADSDVQVGPELDGDETDRDTKAWTAGFDSGSCAVGLYSARQSRAPDQGLAGMDRAHSAYYLVCKAGGGVAAQTFHARLSSALGRGLSLDQALESGSDPGPQALRRVSLAAQRNRHRILVTAAECIGFHMLDTIGDNAAFPGAPIRGAICAIDATYNSLRKVPDQQRSTWQYTAGCIDAQVGNGIMVSSNLAEGFVLFTSASDETRVSLRNDAHSCFPFVTPRLATTRELAMKAAAAHKAGKAHPDSDFVRERFCWKPKDMGASAADIEPPGLWGSHASEGFLAKWGRELGVSALKPVRLQPEAVCIAALEPGKLRAAVRHAAAA